MTTDKVKISKFLSLVLRHKPETIDLVLDENGWADTELLIQGVQKANYSIDIDILKDIVKSNNKQRFKFNQDFSKIRANQGHSVNVDLKLEQKSPPEILFHGTATKNIDSIKQHGLLKQSRHHVHLSSDKETAKNVGMRHGNPIVLEIQSGKMNAEGIDFYLSENGVWLTENVDVKYIKFEL
ncbi:RNA 2'-phosphotransferase [Mangrovivirga sp. M17]|uniref:Probable RNA 2'-phosphotransferase n=1 Tax=Mangrovivirga halotolerans TaxID=2993936 RepID=A0ABT3RPP8_9BACT|nr:RNA 2'-phosphotransferase [Mangrovivirga halotolerans]MCX2743768.1 RNA 2'-phosphotransferase [Mangrovivirga halotolerans]